MVIKYLSKVCFSAFSQLTTFNLVFQSFPTKFLWPPHFCNDKPDTLRFSSSRWAAFTAEPTGRTDRWRHANRPRLCSVFLTTTEPNFLQRLHVGSGEFEGPLHGQRVERRHSLALYLQVQPAPDTNHQFNGVRDEESWKKRAETDAYPCLSYFLKAGKAARGSSSCKEETIIIYFIIKHQNKNAVLLEPKPNFFPLLSFPWNNDRDRADANYYFSNRLI